ncbi:MAG: hypothetical protein GY877_06500, partial [Hyphomicrobium sp.]|nr:hypothetical protein [Hyphomicrobium sp.]
MYEEFSSAFELHPESNGQFNTPEDFQRPKVRRVNRATRTLKTIKSPGAFSLALKMENCWKGAVCSSFWCPRCRHRAAKGLEGRLRDYVLREFGEDQSEAQKRLVFVTPLFGLASVHDARRVKGILREARKDFKALKRAFPELWYQGAFELELIDFRALMMEEGANQVKRETIGNMLGWKTEEARGKLLNCFTPLVLIHAHILMDLRGVDREKVRDWLRGKYSKSPHQIHLKGIRADQTLEALCLRVGSYPFKDRVQFNMSFESQGYRDGGYFSDKELAGLVMLQDKICSNGFKNLLVGSKSRGAM